MLRAVDPVKDVDGFHPVNAGQLYLGRPAFVPATPLGVMALLDEYEVAARGRARGRVGRSDDRRQAGGASSSCGRTRP